MSGCNNHEIGKKIDLYLLNLLTGEELDEFEEHLLDCEHCAAEVRNNHDLILHLLHSDNIKNGVASIVSEQDATDADDSDKKKTPVVSIFRRYRYLWAAAAVIVLLILKPWKIEFRPTDEAVAAENRIVILPLTATDRDNNLIGEMTMKLLITDLADSRQFAVVPDQHINNVLEYLKLSGVEEYGSGITAQIADKTEARWILTGNLVQAVPPIEMSLTLIDTESGDTLINEYLAEIEFDNIYSVIDKVTDRVVAEVYPDKKPAHESGRSVADITTRSPQAYFHYVRGIKFLDKLYYDDAKLCFRQALEYDSTFAMSYYYLAIMGETDLIKKAQEFADGTCLKDQYYIRAYAALLEKDTAGYFNTLRMITEDFPLEAEAYHWWAIVKIRYGQLADAREYLHQALTIDPYYKNAYNQLAYLYLDMEDYENALWACNMYISIAPDEANPYDTRGDVYSRIGEIDKAIESYLKVMELKPFYSWTYSKLVELYQLSQDYDQAIYWLESGWANEHDIPVPAVIYARIFAAQGRLDEALEILDKRLELIKSGVETNNTKSGIITAKAIFLAEKDADAAIAELESISDLIDEDSTDTKFKYYYNYVFILAGERRFKEADSLSVILETLIDSDDEFEQKYDYLTGYTEYQKGNYKKAISVYEQAVVDDPPHEGFVGKYLLSLAYLKTGRSSDAANVLERLLKSTDYERVSHPLFNAGIHFYLAQAYDSLGKQKSASEQYREFLDIWTNADIWLQNKYDFNSIRERINRLES